MTEIFDYNSSWYKTLHNRKVWLFIFLLFLPLTIPSISESIINNYISKLFSDIDKNALSLGSILLIFFVIYSFYSKLRNKFIISDTLAFFVIIITIWTAYYQLLSLYSDDYNYFKIFQVPYLYDTYLVYLIGIFTTVLLIKSKQQIKQPLLENKGFLTDTPIENLENETLGRKEYAIQIAEKLLIGTYQKAFALGITGSWGSGKTSFVNLIKDAINQSDETHKIIIEFNPWNSQSPNQIIKDFFKTFKDALSPYSSELSSEILSYAKDLVQNKKGFWGILSTRIINFFDTNDTISEKYKAIDKTLRKLDKKIIIIIDDLDRLDKAEIIEVIRLIRNTANFYNTCFIVAYDKGYVTNAIGEMNDYQKEYYLEKIFQLEIVLPQIELGVLSEYLIKLLEKIDDSSINHKAISTAINAVKNKEFSILEAYLSNKRDVIRFVNSFLLNYKMVKNDVVLEEFILLELIRFRYPHLISLLFSDNSLFSNKEGIICANESFFTKVETSIEQKEDVKKVKMVVNSLFNTHPKNLRPLSIQYRKNFYSYFALRLSKGQISQQDFNSKKTKDIDSFIIQIDEWVNDGYKIDLRSKFVEAAYKSAEEYKKMVTAHFYLLNNYFSAEIKQSIPSSKLSLRGPVSADIQNLVEYFKPSLEDYELSLESASKFMSKNDVQDFIRELLRSSKFPFFAHEILLRHIHSLDNPILPYNELSEIFTELFIEYTEEANFSLKTLWELFNLTFNKTGVISETQNEGYYPNKAKKALKSSLNKDNIEEFLEISKGVSSHNNAGLIKYQIFDNYTELYDFVNQFPETPFLKQFLKTIKDKKDGEV